ncbi:MAG: AAA family ATPase [Acidimicrobiales bacterium]|nr:AAA family ATPase [Acidimicrobiales bacterium]
MTRPRRLVLAAGTATDIGKTWVGGQVLARLHASGTTVAARKPAQSAEADDPGPSDAEVLAAATGEPVHEVCSPHRSYRVAMAPPMAAAATGAPVPTIDDLLAELRWPPEAVEVGWLETVGGPRSPVAADGDAVTLAERLDPDLVVLVADAGLGTINAALVSAAPLDAWPTVVFLNRFDPDDALHRANLDWLRTRAGLEVIVDLEALSILVRGEPLSDG